MKSYKCLVKTKSYRREHGPYMKQTFKVRMEMCIFKENDKLISSYKKMMF